MRWPELSTECRPRSVAGRDGAAAGGAYRISKSIRDMLVFSEQNVVKDPPFSKLDLISCRNVLIYLDAAAQRRILPMLHYALKPEGFLFPSRLYDSPPPRAPTVHPDPRALQAGVD